MAAFIETLENRRLMSVRPDGVVTNTLPVDTAPLIRKGVLAINGTAGDDNISVRAVAAKRGVRIEVRVVSGQTVGGKLNGSVTRSVLVPVGQVPSVVVIGNGGNDQLDTDTIGYKLTKSIDVDTRVLSAVKPSGRRVYVEDPMSQPMLGGDGDDTAAWAEQSYADIRRQLKAAATSDVLFLGDSHINYLSQIGAEVFKEKFGSVPNVNFGLKGDTTSQLLYRLRSQVLLRGTQAKKIVLQIGTNNVALSNDVDAITRGITAVVSEIRTRVPEARIVLTSILPRRTAAENKVINKVNDRLLATYVYPREGKPTRVSMINLTSYFSGERALARYYRPNSIHLNSRGYRLWVEVIKLSTI